MMPPIASTKVKVKKPKKPKKTKDKNRNDRQKNQIMQEVENQN